jgi:hypothetical protein
MKHVVSCLALVSLHAVLLSLLSCACCAHEFLPCCIAPSAVALQQQLLLLLHCV